MDSTTMKGTVQGYFDRAFDEMTDKELENPLANSGLGVVLAGDIYGGS